MYNQKKIVMEEMETITDQYDEAIDSGTSHLAVVKHELFVNGSRIHNKKKKFSYREWRRVRAHGKQ